MRPCNPGIVTGRPWAIDPLGMLCNRGKKSRRLRGKYVLDCADMGYDDGFGCDPLSETGMGTGPPPMLPDDPDADTPTF